MEKNASWSLCRGDSLCFEDFIILSVVKLDGAFYMSLMNLSFSIQINKS